MLVYPLTYIINCSIACGKFPSYWKEAKVSPLLKKSDKVKTELQNYRPVALLSVPGMVLEKIVANQIERFFETNKLFGEFQFGFRKNKSTISELLTLFDRLLEAKNNKKEIALLMYDLSAAFDTIEPKILCEKLKIYGFNKLSLEWVASFLTGRRQSVIVDGQLSSQLEINIGTPQGSRLSPLLFVIMMADLDLWVNQSYLTNFADDTQSIVISDTKENLISTTKAESSAVISFFSANNLVNNSDKASLMYNSKGLDDKIELDIGSKNIKSKDSEKLLGLQVSSKLDWKAHTDKICRKLKQTMGILNRIQYKIPKNKLLLVAEAIFNSKIRYGIAIYFKPRLNMDDPLCKDSRNIQILQNDMIRIIRGLKRSDKINMARIRKQIGMMSVNQMACYHILMETYNIIQNGSSEDI